jgi:ubiquinone/menaquinone biosynthesis C-methylase UbiE
MTKSQQKIAFGRVAKDYQKYRPTYDPRFYKLLFSLVPGKELDILDLGCGTGKSTEDLVTPSGKRRVAVMGIDPDEAMLREARLSAKKQRLPITYLQGTAEKLQFKNQFNAIISGSAFHWFGNKKSLARIKNALKENGVFVVFWRQTLKLNKPTIGRNLYVKYKYQGIPDPFRDQEFVSSLLISAGFKHVARSAITFSEKKTIAETIGMLKTNSAYALMSSAVKKQFVKEMTEAYRAALGNKKFDSNKLELRICYGFK